jgi:hypothetical protein
MERHTPTLQPLLFSESRWCKIHKMFPSIESLQQTFAASPYIPDFIRQIFHDPVRACGLQSVRRVAVLPDGVAEGLSVGDKVTSLKFPELEHSSETPCVVSRTNYLAMEQAMLGLAGFTSSRRSLGKMIRSMSSMGIAPSKTWSPMTSAPTKPIRFLKRISSGPT